MANRLITDEVKALCRLAYERGDRVKAISREYGVSRSIIFGWVKKKGWKRLGRVADVNESESSFHEDDILTVLIDRLSNHARDEKNKLEKWQVDALLSLLKNTKAQFVEPFCHLHKQKMVCASCDFDGAPIPSTEVEK